MRKVYLFDMITADGYFEGKDHDISWHNVDEEFNEFAIDQLNETGILLFGRVTYEMMAAYWPTAAAIEDDPIVARKMKSMPKIVFSKTLEEASWNNTLLVREHAAEVLSKLKAEAGQDIGLLGSANLTATFIRENLIDEYRIMVNPVVLGAGVPLFEGLERRTTLELSRVRSFSSGNVLLYYVPMR